MGEIIVGLLFNWIVVHKMLQRILSKKKIPFLKNSLFFFKLSSTTKKHTERKESQCQTFPRRSILNSAKREVLLYIHFYSTIQTGERGERMDVVESWEARGFIDRWTDDCDNTVCVESNG